MAEGGALEHMRDWAGKLPGAAGRIAGVFHCCEHAGRLLQDEMDTPERYRLTGATMQRALSLARKLVPHAIHTYALMGEGGDIQAARRVLRWIEATGADEFTARDCHQALKGTFPRRADINPGLAVLMERGYIRRAQPPPDTKPGRPSERLQVNPAIRRR
jgi:putative DNA primase/helicase